MPWNPEWHCGVWIGHVERGAAEQPERSVALGVRRRPERRDYEIRQPQWRRLAFSRDSHAPTVVRAGIYPVAVRSRGRGLGVAIGVEVLQSHHLPASSA